MDYAQSVELANFMTDRYFASHFEPVSRRPAKLLFPMLVIALLAVLPHPAKAQLLMAPLGPCTGTNPTAVIQGMVVNCPVLTPSQLRVQAYVQQLVSRWMNERQLPASDLQQVI